MLYHKNAPTFAVYTLGCKVNQYDSNRIAGLMRARGFAQVDFSDPADVYIIDTCTVTHIADRKSRKAVSRAARNNPQAVIAVTGCAAEWAADQFRRLADDAIVVGNRQKDQLPALILDFLKSQGKVNLLPGLRQVEGEPYPLPVATPTRAVLKVQDGCNRHCTFCIIPRVRGTPRSRPLDEVLAEAGRAVEGGAREIVVTGVIVGHYGGDLPGHRRRLPELLRQLEKVEGLRRIRLSSLDPRDVSEELVEAMGASSKICPHLHLCLQSGSAAVLKAMRRGYTPAQYAEWVRRFRATLPHLGLTTDVLVGFPGETEESFQETLQFVQQMRFSGMHVFPYSARPGTAAAAMPKPVPPPTIERRAKQLRLVARQLAGAYAQRYIGRTAEILVEEVNTADGTCVGLTDTYVRVVAAGDGAPSGGTFLNIRITAWQADHLVGEVRRPLAFSA